MPKKKSQPRAGNLRVLTWNSHVSVGLRRGQLDQVLDAYPGVHIATIQEVKRRSDLVDALARSSHAGKFEVVPRKPYRGSSAMVYHLVRRSKRFSFPRVSTRKMPSAKYRRELLETEIFDRRTGRTINLLGFHLDPLGRGLVRADPRARARHMAQAQDVANAMADVPAGNVAIAAGDGNEKLSSRIPTSWRSRSFLGRMLKANSVASSRVTARGDRWAGLDDVWHRRAEYVRAINRRRRPVAGGQPEHPVVITTYRIQPR